MNKVLIHIGYHKTGSTWLQNNMFISESDVFIPVSSRTQGQSTLARKFIYTDDNYLLNSFDTNEQIIKEDLQKLRKSKEYSGNKTPVMSHERLSGNPHSSGFDASIIANRIESIFPDSKILIVIREQTSWILSNYFQYLSIGGTHSLTKYLNKGYDGRIPWFSPNYIKYHHLIEDYQTRFGKNNVLVLPYELFNADKSLFFNKLGAFIGKDIFLNSDRANKKVNLTSNYYINYKLRRLNVFIRSTSVNNHTPLKSNLSSKLTLGLKKFLNQFISKKKNKAFKNRLLHEIEAWSNNRFNESNEITQSLINMNLEEVGYKTKKESTT